MSDATQQGDTGGGFLQGVEPGQGRLVSDWQQQGTAAQQVSQPVQVTDLPVQPTGRFFTEEDIAEARRQEKEKLYPRLSTMEEQLKALQAEREREIAERKRLEDEALAAQRAKEESEMEVRDLLRTKEQEWESRWNGLQQQREQEQAIFAQERRMAELDRWRQERIEQEQEYIIPELRDYVMGNNEEEIEASIEQAKQRSAGILANIQAAQQPFSPMRGASPTAPPMGPMEQQPTYEQLSAEDIRNMSMDDYRRMRTQLLQASSPQNNSGRRG